MKQINIPRLSRAVRAHLGGAAGGLAAAFGAGMQWGTGMGLLVGGALAGAYYLLVYDVDDGPGT